MPRLHKYVRRERTPKGWKYYYSDKKKKKKKKGSAGGVGNVFSPMASGKSPSSAASPTLRQRKKQISNAMNRKMSLFRAIQRY